MKTVSYHPWVHAVIVVTAGLCLPLLIAGGTVTSTGTGMTDPEWPTHPFFLIQFLLDHGWTEAARQLGFVIEHAHRLLAYTVGFMTILLTGMCLRYHTGPYRWLGIAALLLVSLQGVIGGARVLLHVPAGLELAMLHGILGQMVFAGLVGLAAISSRVWFEGQVAESFPEASRLKRLAYSTVFIVVVQLVIGTWLRQFGGSLAAPILIHGLFAFAIVAHAVLFWGFTQRHVMPTVLTRPIQVFLGLVSIQVLLGLSAWLSGAGRGATHWEHPSTATRILATSHVLVGACVLATSVVLTLRCVRHLPAQHREWTLPAGGVA